MQNFERPREVSINRMLKHLHKILCYYKTIKEFFFSFHIIIFVTKTYYSSLWQEETPPGLYLEATSFSSP